jgi:hypothetical protein
MVDSFFVLLCSSLFFFVLHFRTGIPADVTTISVADVAEAASMEFQEQDPLPLKTLRVVANLICTLRNVWLAEDWTGMEVHLNETLQLVEHQKCLDDDIVPVEVKQELELAVLELSYHKTMERAEMMLEETRLNEHNIGRLFKDDGESTEALARVQSMYGDMEREHFESEEFVALTKWVGMAFEMRTILHGKNWQQLNGFVVAHLGKDDGPHSLMCDIQRCAREIFDWRMSEALQVALLLLPTAGYEEGGGGGSAASVAAASVAAASAATSTPPRRRRRSSVSRRSGSMLGSVVPTVPLVYPIDALSAALKDVQSLTPSER